MADKSGAYGIVALFDKSIKLGFRVTLYGDSFLLSVACILHNPLNVAWLI